MFVAVIVRYIVYTISVASPLYMHGLVLLFKNM